MAAALIVSAGIATAQSAGAEGDTNSPDNVTCTTNTGALKFNPGVSLTTRHGQFVTNPGNSTFTGATVPKRGTPGTLGECTGTGITGTTGGSLYFGLQRAAVNCKSIVASHNVFQGHAALVWNAGESNDGVVTNIKLNVTFNSYRQIKFTGIVTSSYLHGGKIRGTALIPTKLKSAGNDGGECGNSKAGRVKLLNWTQNGDFTINIKP